LGDRAEAGPAVTAIDEIVYMLDEAFSGAGIEESNEGQSFMQNVLSVEGSMWRTAPDRGVRTIESIALHVGSCKVMYDEYAFGPGKLFWGDPEVQPWSRGEAPFEATIGWLQDVHGHFVEHVRALDDEDLATPRPTNWGELRETRWLISTIAQHDVYHAGEVNHIRSLLAGSDAWRWG
jgi:DinB family protein